MRKNGYFVKGLVALSLVGTLAMADGDDENNQELKIKSSIQIENDESEDTQNSKVKITVEDVAKIIKDKSLGKILSVKLENENGNLVYKSEVFKNNQITDIIVDAGDGKILASILDKKSSNDDDENDNEKDDNEENDKNEAWYKFW